MMTAAASQPATVSEFARPRLSVKLAYWLSDVSAPGRGNLKIVPGSHLTNWIGGRRGATSSGPTPKAPSR
jgi:hypothetical protein